MKELSCSFWIKNFVSISLEEYSFLNESYEQDPNDLLKVKTSYIPWISLRNEEFSSE